MSTALGRRLERLEDWRHTAESAAAVALERLEAMARVVEHLATAVDELTEELAEQRGERRQRRRLRAAAYASAGLSLAALGALADRFWP